VTNLCASSNAFVQHYPFIWNQDFLLLGWNLYDESVWYKAFPTERGMARGRFYNSSQVSFRGKRSVRTFWQSWVDVFDIEKRGVDRVHEYFTGVYLILQQFPNLRYRCDPGNGWTRDPENAVRVTGVSEYPFNGEHPFMQENSAESNGVENDFEKERDVETDTDTDHEDRGDASFTKEEQTDPYDNEEDSTLMLRQPKQRAPPADSREPMSISSSRSSGHTANNKVEPYQTRDGLMSRPLHMSREPIFRAPSHKSASTPSSEAANITRMRADTNSKAGTPTLISPQPSNTLPSRAPSRVSNPTKSPYFAGTRKQDILELPRRDSQPYKDLTLRVPIDEPRWSNTNFKFAAVASIHTVPGASITESNVQ
jgi:hypothetical protein